MYTKWILFSGFLGLILFSIVYVESQSSEQGSKRGTLCAMQRGDYRCNDNSDCCDGRECDSFGYCVRRR